MTKKVNVENCVNNQKKLDIHTEVFTRLQGEKLKNKLQLFLESNINKLESNRKWIAEGYITALILKSVQSLFACCVHGN